MRKMKSAVESIENYVASSGFAVLKYHRFLVNERGFKSDYAMKKAGDYGLKMLLASIGSRDELAKAESTFRELSAIYNEMADVCYDTLNQ